MPNATTLSSYNSLDESDYLSEEMLNYFRHKLNELYEQVIKKEEALSLSFTEVPIRVPDRVDQGANEELLNQNYMFQEHENHLQQDIESALQRIDDGVFGYCEETGEPIGLKRLLAIPYARYCLKVQEHKEQDKKEPWGK